MKRSHFSSRDAYVPVKKKLHSTIEKHDSNSDRCDSCNNFNINNNVKQKQELIGFEIYRQMPGIQSIHRHFVQESIRMGQKGFVKNNYILCSKYEKLLVLGYVRQVLLPQSSYNKNIYSVSDTSSVILKYVSNNNNDNDSDNNSGTFDFNVNRKDGDHRWSSIFLDINGIDLDTNRVNLKQGEEQEHRQITFSLQYKYGPCKLSNYNEIICMGLIGFRNNISNSEIKYNTRGKTQSRILEMKNNAFLRRRDFFNEFEIYPLYLGAGTLSQSKMKRIGFSKHEDDYVTHMISNELNVDNSTIFITVDIGKNVKTNVVNNKMYFYEKNNNSGIKTDIKSIQLRNNMIYIHIRSCWM